MGRAPCCDKANVKRGPWSPEEDGKLKSYIEQHGTAGNNWITLPQKIGLKRCGKSCRLRWLNYLRPNIRHGGFSEEEDNIICNLFMSIGSRWSIIAAQLPGRTDNDIKNYWNTKLKNKLLGKAQLRNKDKIKQGRKILSKNQDPSSPSNITYTNNHISLQMYNFQDNLPWVQPSTAIPYKYSTAEDPRVNDDHASIRKLLISLGGNFSNEEDDHHQIIKGPRVLNDDRASLGSNYESSLLLQPICYFTRQEDSMFLGPNFDSLDHAMTYGIPQKLQNLGLLYDDDIVMGSVVGNDTNQDGFDVMNWYYGFP